MIPSVPVNDEERVFLRHIADLCRMSKNRNITTQTFFLTEREQLLAVTEAEREGAPFSLFGGYDDAVRRIMFIGESVNEQVASLTLRFRESDSLTHRDFLGSFMALGVKRETLGDILIGTGYAIVFCTNAAEKLILSDLSQVGRVGVRITSGMDEPIPLQEFEEIKGTVASLRIDSLVALSAGISRDSASELIAGGKVVLDCTECKRNDRIVEAGSVFSIRGYGKFRLKETGGLSKKGKTHIIIEKYK